MRYTIRKEDKHTICLVKHTDSKGFFQNVASSEIGEIRLFNSTECGWFEDFLTEEDGVYYMEIGSVDGWLLMGPYRGEAPRKGIQSEYGIPVSERIKFLYEALSSNSNYNCLKIRYKPADSTTTTNSLFELDICDDEFVISDL